MSLVLIKKFIYKTRSRGLAVSLYLTYYYLYRYLYDLRFGTRFTGTSTAAQFGINNPAIMGNFPAHPKILRRFLQKIPRENRSSLLDVGCGSGAAMHVALRCGFESVSGVELIEAVAEKARVNLRGYANAKVFCGDIFEFEAPDVDVILFYRPFSEVLLFKALPRLIDRTSYIILFNYDENVEIEGFVAIYTYKHWIYKNFRGRLLVRST